MEIDELILELNARKVRYLVIGGQAMRLFGMPRSTMDCDLFLEDRVWMDKAPKLR
jgi:hypothetical protein